MTRTGTYRGYEYKLERLIDGRYTATILLVPQHEYCVETYATRPLERAQWVVRRVIDILIETPTRDLAALDQTISVFGEIPLVGLLA